MTEKNRPVRTRFAPSPTGEFHVGGLRTALFTWLTARHAGGRFVLRIEDTDRTRFDPGALGALTSGLRWLGLDWDEGPEVGGPHGPYLQSERLPLYQEQIRTLLDSGSAYRCFCTAERLAELRRLQEQRQQAPGYDRHCRGLRPEAAVERAAAGEAWVARLKVPLQGTTVFHDLVRGEISYENAGLQDLVLMKSDGFPTYHFANVVDDHFMEISHVTRASEWIPSTPSHILIYQAFGWEPPVFAHLPVILDPSGKGKMSKRKKGGGGPEMPVYVREFREAGYLPEAVLNYLALLGWSDGTDQTEFTREELIAKFDLTRVNPTGAAFDYQKLDWLNGVWIRKMEPAAFARLLGEWLGREGIEAGEATLAAVGPLVQERVRGMKDALPLVDFFFREPAPYGGADLVPPQLDAASTLRVLERLSGRLAEVERPTAADAEGAIRGIAADLGAKVQPIAHVARVALGGRPVGPPLFETIEVLGPDVTLRRLGEARRRLEAVP
ncbi:glutamate--tRNA ligase [Myxococcota bacterium]|nr:glutamate--tRNA ligase [Myxococcota bacterium]